MDNNLVHNIILCIAFVLSTSSLVVCGSYELKAGQRFPYHADLSDKYGLSWDFNKTHIIFKIRVMTTGYIRLAISRDKASDLFIAWVDDKGNVHSSDYHNAMKPALDASQDWVLLEGDEQKGNTTITVLRRLDTGDQLGDVSILPDGTTNLQFGYNKYDLRPDGSNLFNDDHTKISQKFMMLLNPVSSHRRDPVNVHISQQFKIPAGAVINKCSMYQFSDVKEKHHIIKFGASIEQGKQGLIRAIALYGCSNSQSLTRDNDQLFDCAGSQEEQQCYDPILLYGSGGTSFELPGHIGLPVTSSSRRFMLSVFYTNEGSVQDVTVRVGFEAQMTNRLRQHDAAFFLVGRNHDETLIIPPHQKQFVMQGVCHSDCLKKGMNSSINVVADILHAHAMGREMATRHFRGNKELEPIQKDRGYHYHYQEIRMLEKERMIKPEDTLVTQCSFDSRTRSKATLGGFHTTEAMCMSYLLYYPKRDLVLCASSLVIPQNVTYGGLDWTNRNRSDAAIKQLDQWDHSRQCVGIKTHLFGGRHKFTKGHLVL